MKNLRKPQSRLSLSRRNQKSRTKSPTTLPGGVKRGFRTYVAIVLVAAILLSLSVAVLATSGKATDPLASVNKLSDFIFGLIKAIGLILLGFGIVQIGMSLKSHDPSQRANGFLTMAGGVMIFFCKEILNLITG